MTATPQITPGRKTSRAKGYITRYQPQARTRELLQQVTAVLEEYEDYWPLTIRQVFYRLVGAHGFAKSEGAYKRLVHHMGEARRARVIPFDAIRDDGIATAGSDQFADADHFLHHVREMAQTYRRDKLAAQPVYLEVWCEAAGMVLQLANVADPFSIRVYSSSGFDSLTAKYDLAQRICAAQKPAVILHLGDCDPSGVSIFDSIAEDVAAFVHADRLYASIDVRFTRVALTPAQVNRLNLPTAPPKDTDSRTRRWNGDTCQLEALAPDMIATLLNHAIRAELDINRLQADAHAERTERANLSQLLLTAGGAA